jgi:hypothetical protein
METLYLERNRIEREARVITWGIPTAWFLQIPRFHQPDRHRVGPRRLVWAGNREAIRRLDRVVSRTTILARRQFGFDPPRAFGVISLELLAVAVAAIYAFRLAGAWRCRHRCRGASLQRLRRRHPSVPEAAVLQPLAQAQSEPPFIVVQLAVLIAFPVPDILAGIKFYPEIKAGT